MCAHMWVFGWGPPHLSEPRHGTCYLFLISPALCGFKAVTGLRVETGTNEQLHPACLPGIMGLQTDRASVCALSLHSRFVIPLLPFVSICLYLCFSPSPRSMVQLSLSHLSRFFPYFLNSLYSYHVILKNRIILFFLSLSFSPLTLWWPHI